jgi:hypothetical protein
MNALHAISLYLPVFLMTAALPAGTPAQETDAERQLTEMRKLDFLVGTWEGSSDFRMGPGEAKTATGTEQVETRLGGLVLLVQALFLDVNGEKVHEALAVISFDETAGHYRFSSYLADGRSTDGTGRLVDGVFEWQPSQTQNVRYRVQLDEQGRWHEIGEYTRGDGSWEQFFEMTLARTESM